MFVELYPDLGYPEAGYSVGCMDIRANKACGRSLAQMRRDAGLTQIALAARLDVPQSFVSKVETGERSLKVYEQFDYAAALGLDVGEFVRRVGEALGLS